MFKLNFMLNNKNFLTYNTSSTFLPNLVYRNLQKIIFNLD